MQFSEAVTTTTRTYIVPKVYDQISKGSPTLMKLLQNAKNWKTGYKYEFPIKYQDSGTAINTGIADKLPTDRVNVRTTASFEPKMATAPVVVADIETTLNMGDERIVDLLETEYNSQAQSLIQLMGQNLFLGTGVGLNWDSLFGAADDGTNVTIYGGLSRTTYPSWKGYYLGAAGALTLAKMATAYDAVTVGTQVPDLIVTTKALWSTYESLLTPTVRAGYTQNGYPRMNAFGMVPSTQGLAGQQGFECLWFRGSPVVKDEQVPSGKMFFITTDYFGFKGINIIDDQMEQLNFKNPNDGTPDGVPGRIPSTRGFNYRVPLSPVDQLAKISYVLYAGNYIAEEPRLQGQLAGLS